MPTRTLEFDFDLPPDLIALRPAAPRDSARMLVVRDGQFLHAHVRDLPSYLASGDALVLNDTRVFPARLRGRRTGRGVQAGVELLLHSRIAPESYVAFARPARKLVPGDEVGFGDVLQARVREKTSSSEVVLEFNRMGKDLDDAIERIGEVPLPPYIAGKRKLDALDAVDYQTIFAARNGSVAAPTAGLHFTDELFEGLARRGVSRERLTLHVGPGTFLPIAGDDADGHKLHSEWAELSADTAAHLNTARGQGGRIVATGTTSVRTLESAADEFGKLSAFSGMTDIFIKPGYKFTAVDVMLTNFHLPRSSLFMLVSAFCGLPVMKAAYSEAIEKSYRFYSYGDACLLFRSP